MTILTNKQNCCGCGACEQKCPKHCISLLEDNEGFLYPQVINDSCIDCGLCEEVCPMVSPYDSRYPLQVHAAINQDEMVRMESSSGGLFTLLAENIIKQGGVVFGARFDVEWQVTLDYTESCDGLARFRGSKYVQARMGNTYKQCEQFLKDGRKVLFTGSPCQIAGLYHFLRKQYNNLTTCDFVCHGVPSPKVWRLYLKEVKGGTNRIITDIQFRNKDNGWKRYNFRMTYEENNTVTNICSYHRDNLYMRAYISNMILRPSCYICKSKQGRSMSDITIADYWGVQVYHPEMDDDKGTGLVLINTQKGKAIFEAIQIQSVVTDYDKAILYNSAIIRSVIPHPNRAKFFDKLEQTPSLSRLINNCTRSSLKQKIAAFIFSPKRVLSVLQYRIWGGKE